jgi:uncharacterized protein YqcC (DUF446 family)
MMRMPETRAVLSKLEQIETEMKRVGLWQEQPLQAEQYDFNAAFAGDTMSFAQWLQFIFVPSVKRAAANENFPSQSQVGIKAVREFDGMQAASRLIQLLSEFDGLF